MSAEVTLTEAERAELVSAVSNALRVADGDHAMGTGALAEVAVDRIADWLAARVEQARAEAWDEGHRFTGYEPGRGENPYREAGQS